MVFAHDTEAALAAAAALVNSGHDTDTLTTTAELADFVREWRFTGRLVGDEAELAAVRALRPELERLWYAGPDEAVPRVNRMLRAGRALPQLVAHDGWSYHLHATTPETDLAVRLAVEAAMAMVDVIRAGELDRLRVCTADDCRDVLVDLSKNRSRRFCDTSCGNRSNVAAYRARKAAGG